MNSPDFRVLRRSTAGGKRVLSPPMPAAPQSPAKPPPAGLAPERSLTQRMDALKRANEIRTRRARLKRDLKAGRVQIHGLLLDPPGIPAHGQGLRPAAGRPEVRAREGESHPHALPDLAEQDDRRPLRAPAQRARLVPAAIAIGRGRPADASQKPILVITGPSGVGKGTLIKGLLERWKGSRSPSPPRRGRRGRGRWTVATTTSSAPRTSTARAQRRVRRARRIRRQPLRHAALRARAPGAGMVLEIDVQGARQVRETPARRGAGLHRAARRSRT